MLTVPEKNKTTQDIHIHVFREIWFFTNVSPFEMPSMWCEIVNCRDWYPPWSRDTVYVYSWVMQWQPLEQEICEQMETKRLPVFRCSGYSYFRELSSPVKCWNIFGNYLWLAIVCALLSSQWKIIACVWAYTDRPLRIDLMNSYVNLIVARFHGRFYPPLVPTSYGSGIKSSAPQPSVTSLTSLNRLQRTRRDKKMLRAFPSQLIAI